MQADASASVRLSTATSTTTSPLSVNLMALPTRLTTIWRSRPGSPTRASGTSGGDVVRQLQLLLCRPRRQRLQRVAQGVAQIEIDRLQLELAGFDLREVQDVVEQPQQRIGRLLHQVQVLALLGRQLGVEQQFGHADDAVHRRADFVAHVGQEFALGPVGPLGLFLGDRAAPAPHAPAARSFPAIDSRRGGGRWSRRNSSRAFHQISRLNAAILPSANSDHPSSTRLDHRKTYGAAIRAPAV